MNQKIIVMGANGGTGESLAIRLAKAGYDICATMRDTGNASESLRAHVQDIRAVDVTDVASIQNAFAESSEENPVAGFAYCIGSIDLLPLKTTKDEHFLKAYEVNVLGAIRSLRFLEKSLKAGRGSIVLFSSIAVDQGFGNHTVIASAKGAIEGLGKSLAAEWAGQVRVNIIAPSLTDTSIASPFTSSQTMRESIEKMHPIQRLGTPDDLAATAQFLIGPESGWITGQIIRVDGGRSTLKPKG